MYWRRIQEMQGGRVEMGKIDKLEDPEKELDFQLWFSHEYVVELLLRENSVEWEGTMFVLCMEMVWWSW